MTLVLEQAGTVVGHAMVRIHDAWGQSEVAAEAEATQAELGWVLDPAHGGRGLMTEAVVALIDVCFGPLGLRRVIADCFADNTASWRLMERVGMRREAHTVRDSLHRTKGWLDGYTYALLAEEWSTCSVGNLDPAGTVRSPRRTRGSRCLKPSSSPPPAARSGGPTRVRWSSIRPDDLSTQIVNALLAKVPELPKDQIEDLIMGCGQPAGEQGFNIARVVAILAGLDDVPGVTVNRYCSSSLQTIRMAAHAIKAGEGDVFIAAGVECVSRYGFGASDTAPNSVFKEAGERTAERVARRVSRRGRRRAGCPTSTSPWARRPRTSCSHEDVTREEMDEFAKLLAGPRRAPTSRTASSTTRSRRSRCPTARWCPRTTARAPGTTLEGLAQLKPVFRPDGQVTAGNACPLNDGAAAVLVMSDTRARELGLTPLARVVASGVSGLNPEIMGLGPIEASRQALARAGKTIDDIDLVEINEAFAAQVVPSAKHLGIPLEKLNVHGGAIALGHPFGMTGARIMTTLIHGLQAEDKTFGLETMCVGGGQGMAMIVERLS